MKISFEVKVDIDKDAWNYWHACNNISHGVDWKERIDLEVQKHIVDKTQVQAFRWLLPYLRKKHKEINLEFVSKQIKDSLKNDFPKVIKKIEEITQKPIYRDDFTLFLTTLRRSPYNFDQGYIWIYYQSTQIINTLGHELLHFQFMHYYSKDVWQKVNGKEWAAIKEGMVVILNDFLPEWTGVQEKTYPMYRAFAEELLELWQGPADRQFDKFVAGAVELVKNHDFN